MKKTIKFIFILLLTFFIFPVICNAATNIDTINQRPVVGSSIEVRLRVDYGQNTLINEAHYYIKYDPTKLELENLHWTQSEGTYTVQDGIITIDKENTTKAWEYGEPISMVFKAINEGVSNITVQEKAPAKNKDGNKIVQYYSGITINAIPPSTATKIGKLTIEGYSLSPTFNAEKYEYTLTVPSNVTNVNILATKGEKNQTITGTGTRALSYGENKIRVVVTAQNGDSSTYLIIVYRKDDRSGDVSLKKLSVSNTDITYDKNKTSYEATVSRSVDSVFITAQTTDPKAQLVGTGKRNLNIGSNIFEIKVSSKDGKNQIYTINIIRSEEELKQNNPSTSLASLTINGHEILLKDDVFYYATSVEKDIESLNIGLITKSTTAKYKITGANKIKKGFNNLTIVVEDEDLEPSEYIIKVYKQPSITKKYTSLDDVLLEEKLTEHIYFVTSDPSIKINEEILQKINKDKKDLYYNFVNKENKIIYQLIIPHGKYTNKINPFFEMEIDNPLTYTSELPKDIEVMLYTGDVFVEDTELQVYTYDEIGEYTELTSALKVVNGYLNFTTNGGNKYVFSKQTFIEKNNFDFIGNLPMIIFGILILLLILFIILKRKKSKNTIKSEEPLY